MKRQILPVLVVACMAAFAPVGAANAKAMECSVARPAKAQGHWSWRLIDGRKCWYAGKTVISKSLLQWPAVAPAQAKADVVPAQAKVVAVPVVAATEIRSDPMDAQARLLDDANSFEANSFEARWRARVITE
ncbi:hypothetical protein GWE18_20775 [Bradyrhizobium sp. CSA112]|uniref:hypothetical protein n=1 Tax=Bradyrhizobium sp. CSA112 TaxID=2699170 RepID=UPI0023AE7571|nr:hypothetical protein [Bradyrhizobium sp. CSA112]MDE5455234.1 hypothetical protein [Bradyrhizobium sp. CSA112]